MAGMTQQDLLTVWAEEGKAALDAKKSGIILDLWKVVAQRKVLESSKSQNKTKQNTTQTKIRKIMAKIDFRGGKVNLLLASTHFIVEDGTQ